MRVRDAILAIYAARYPGVEFAPLERAFADFKALFEGGYPGYLACDTLYHDMRHTLDMSSPWRASSMATSAPARPRTASARAARSSAC